MDFLLLHMMHGIIHYEKTTLTCSKQITHQI